MNNNLTPEKRLNKNGVLVTKHVRNGSTTTQNKVQLPAPAAPQTTRVRRAFKPNEAQLQEGYFGIPINQPGAKYWGPHIIGRPHPDLAAVPSTDEKQKEQPHRDWYHFRASDVEYYSVLSVVRPFDALNLLQRGIRSAEEALEFLEDHGLKHLAGDYSAYTDEILRHRINGNMGMVYLNDIIDAQADPVLAGEWVKMCAQKSIMDEARFIKDEMLSGQVTVEDLKAVGIKNIGADIKAVAQYIIHSKNDNNPDFTLEEIEEVMEDVTRDLTSDKADWKSKPRWAQKEFTFVSKAPARLAIARVMGSDAALMYRPSVKMHDYELQRMEEAGNVDPERLGRLTWFATKVNVQLEDEEDFIAMSELYDTGVEVKSVNAFLSQVGTRMGTAESLTAAKEGLHTAVVSGWL